MPACPDPATVVARLHGAPAYVYACHEHTTAAVRLLAQLTRDPDAEARITALAGAGTPCSITRQDSDGEEDT